jgi:uncharacterized membrane protein
VGRDAMPCVSTTFELRRVRGAFPTDEQCARMAGVVRDSSQTVSRQSYLITVWLCRFTESLGFNSSVFVIFYFNIYGVVILSISRRIQKYLYYSSQILSFGIQ